MDNVSEQPSHLCGRCSVLEFQAGRNGYTECKGDGDTVHVLPSQEGPGPSGDEYCHDLPFHLETEFPEMPDLLPSCSFCSILKDTVLRNYANGKHPAPDGKELVLEIDDIGAVYLYDEAGQGPAILAAIRVQWDIMDRTVYPEYVDGKLRDPDEDIFWADCGYFRVLANSSSPVGDYLRIQYVPTRSNLDLFSPGLVESIEQNLEQCSTTHSKCSKFQYMDKGQPQERALPARLLEISGTKQDKRIRLVETCDVNRETVKYAALSYCWGTAGFIKTTEDCYSLEHAHQDTCEDLKNIPWSNYLHAIHWSDLPQGFQDAIELCWEAEIRYLWIDSLCIVQGNQQDWNRESARMKDIYMGAFLTIVLASTKSPLEGALKARREFTQPISVPLSRNGTYLGSYLIEPTMYTSDIFEIESPVTKPWKHANEAIYDSRWRARGWTFQESYLPARKIYICEGRIHFSCKTHSRLEGLPGKFPPLDRFADGDEDEHENQGYLQWYTWVQHYTQRELTEPLDKLPAITALASRKGRISNDRYLAGIWENDLEAGLLWHRRAFKYGEASSTAHPLHRSPVYRAPSWSWSAYDGSVTFLAQYFSFSANSKSEIELLEASCPRANPDDPYGRLASLNKTEMHDGRAYLRLRGKVVSVMVQKKARFHSGGRRDFDQDATVRSDQTGFQGYSGVDCREEWEYDEWKQATVLLVYTSERFGKKLRVGLLLRKLDSASKETEYERVGFFYDNEDEDNFSFDQQERQNIYLV